MGGAIFILAALGIAYRGHRVIRLSGSHAQRQAISPSEADARIQAAQSRLKDQPEDLDALTQLALALYAKGPDYYVDAMNALDKARSLGATNETLFLYAGVMYDTLGLPEYAINELKKYLRHFPNDYEALVRLGNLYFRLGRNDDAYQVYREAIRLWPKDATVLFNYAVVSVKKGDYAGAENMLAQVKLLTGSLPPGGLFEEGEIARLKGLPDAAADLYQQELVKTPNYLPAMEALESIMRQKGLSKAARELRAKIAEVKKTQHG